ncbi:MAG TPA: SDR family oxidoreductase [Spirochaetia bacterium]|nr:SDR family oxidoreductase [Spirochaetia bacterium]
MKVLFIGGTGNISLDCTHEAVKAGIELYHLNRGQRRVALPPGVKTLTGDIRKPDEVARIIKDMQFDVVVDWIAFVPEHIETDIRLFSGKTAQFIFISSASVYKKPVTESIITEGTMLHNPFWEYSRNKIACEERLVREYRERGFPITIVRPSHTYSTGWFPTTFGSADFTVPARMLAGKPIVVHGDGQSLWTLTHTKDFAVGFNGLLGNDKAIGEVFQITTDEALSWDEIHRIIGRSLGVVPKIVHIPSDFIANYSAELGSGILGDKAYSVIFDNTKIKRWVPSYKAVIPFHVGMRWSAEWHHAHPESAVIDKKSEDEIEGLLAAWGKAHS